MTTTPRGRKALSLLRSIVICTTLAVAAWIFWSETPSNGDAPFLLACVFFGLGLGVFYREAKTAWVKTQVSWRLSVKKFFSVNRYILLPLCIAFAVLFGLAHNPLTRATTTVGVYYLVLSVVYVYARMSVNEKLYHQIHADEDARNATTVGSPWNDNPGR